jgi:hypothetical protein
VLASREKGAIIHLHIVADIIGNGTGKQGLVSASSFWAFNHKKTGAFASPENQFGDNSELLSSPFAKGFFFGQSLNLLTKK